MVPWDMEEPASASTAPLFNGSFGAAKRVSGQGTVSKQSKASHSNQQHSTSGSRHSTYQVSYLLYHLTRV